MKSLEFKVAGAEGLKLVWARFAMPGFGQGWGRV